MKKADMQYVPVEMFCQRYGYSFDAVLKKIINRKWVETREWLKAPDGKIYIDVVNVEKSLNKKAAGTAARRRS